MYKFYNTIKREFAYPDQTDSTGKGKFLVYGPHNAFPLKLSELVQGSPTASACIDTYADFITGEGFNNPALESLKINNQGTTLWEFHQVLSASLALFDGLAFEVKYAKTAKILEIYNQPFENCRLGKPDDKGYIGKVFYNPYFGSDKYQESHNKCYYTYSQDDKKAIAEFKEEKDKYLGQMFWFGVRSPLNIFYPKPRIYASRDSMEVERRTMELFKNNLQGGFLQAAMIKLIGDPNEPTADPDGGTDNEGNHRKITKGELFDRIMSEQFSGSDRANYMMALWGNSKEEWPEIQGFPTFANSDIYKTQSDLAGEKIMIATKTPSILVVNREGQSLGGDGNTMRAAVKLMQQRALRPQSILIDIYKKILPRMGVSIGDLRITPYNPYPEIQNIDPAVWAELTKEERRKWIGDNMEITLLPATVQAPEPVPQPEPIESKFVNLSVNSYPEKAKENIKKALQWQEQTGVRCGGNAGASISLKIVDGLPLTFKEVKRLSNFLSKNAIYGDKEWGKSCDAVKYALWGGPEMMVWANEKVKEWLN